MRGADHAVENVFQQLEQSQGAHLRRLGDESRDVVDMSIDEPLISQN